MLTISAALALFISVMPVASGSEFEPDSIAGSLSEMYAVIADDLVAAARRMPAEKYGYRPTTEVRSFGQIVAHLAGSQFLYCAQAKGARFDPALLTKLGPVRKYSEATAASPPLDAPSKDELVALLDHGVAYCKETYGGMTDAAAVEAIGQGDRRTIRFRPLAENVAHSNEHYGNLVTYLRLEGLVPPSTERRKP